MRKSLAVRVVPPSTHLQPCRDGADFSISIFTLSATFTITVRVFHVRDHPVNPRGSDDMVAGLERGDQARLFFLPPHLRPDHHVIHDDENEDERKDANQSGTGGRRGTGAWAKR